MNFFEWSVDHVLGKKTNAGGAGSMGAGWTDHIWSHYIKYTDERHVFSPYNLFFYSICNYAENKLLFIPFTASWSDVLVEVL